MRLKTTCIAVAGKGVPQSDAKAESHFAMACKEKHLQACYHQAFMLYAAAASIPLLPGKDSNSPAPALPPSSGNSKDNEKVMNDSSCNIYTFFSSKI